METIPENEQVRIQSTGCTFLFWENSACRLMLEGKFEQSKAECGVERAGSHILSGPL